MQLKSMGALPTRGVTLHLPGTEANGRRSQLPSSRVTMLGGSLQLPSLASLLPCLPLPSLVPPEMVSPRITQGQGPDLVLLLGDTFLQPCLSFRLSPAQPGHIPVPSGPERDPATLGDLGDSLPWEGE